MLLFVAAPPGPVEPPAALAREGGTEAAGPVARLDGEEPMSGVTERVVEERVREGDAPAEAVWSYYALCAQAGGIFSSGDDVEYSEDRGVGGRGSSGHAEWCGAGRP